MAEFGAPGPVAEAEPEPVPAPGAALDFDLAELLSETLRPLAPLAAPLVADLTLDDSIEKMASRAIAAIDGPFAVAGTS